MKKSLGEDFWIYTWLVFVTARFQFRCIKHLWLREAGECTKGYVMTTVGCYEKLMSHLTLGPPQFICEVNPMCCVSTTSAFTAAQTVDVAFIYVYTFYLALLIYFIYLVIGADINICWRR